MKITPHDVINPCHIQIEYDGIALNAVTSIDTETGECVKVKFPIETISDGSEFVTELVMLDPAKLHVYICKPS